MDIGNGGLDNGMYAVGGGGVVWLAQMLWTKLFSTEGKANDALVQQLSDRVASLEERQKKQEADLDEERRLRRAAEEKVHQLELYVMDLKGVLRQHNIEAPQLAASPSVDPADLKPGGTD
jgi:hypothetical protein